MERMVDGAWVPVDELDREGQTWNEIESLFKEVDDATGPAAEDSGAGGDMAVPVDSDGAGDRPLVEVAQGEGSDGRGVTVGIDANDLVDEIPGLTTGDGRSGTKGTRTVLQRLRQGARKRNSAPNADAPHETPSRMSGETRSQPVQDRPTQRIEVSEKAARARGPAVRDTTERRQAARAAGVKPGGLAKSTVGVGRANGEITRTVSKPAPGILSGQPKWVRDLFEAHFRSSRTRELRQMPSGPSREVDGKTVTPNRMKMSREDFAIGWLVLLEAARRDPAILHTKALNGRNSEASEEGLPVLLGGAV